MPTPKLQQRLVDADHPWLGLESFTEGTQKYFFGRDAEIADIYVRTRENALTILYGQSGLGKTSLLGAGLIPKLKIEHCQPILIRLRYEKTDLPLLEQVKSALAAAVFSSGEQAASCAAATLWELLHHTGIRPAAACPPVLIFDQFEEIFTLGQRAERVDEVRALFIELADVIENRPPAALKQRFTEDRRLVLDYDFAPSPLRVVITLREDYLSHLEQWERTLPSLMRNRMALHLLSGPQALHAVFRPGQMEGRHLVDEETAARIVRFVANRGPDVPLEAIGAVPPLLSLVCDELNTQRIEQKKDRITAERVGTRLAGGKAAREEALAAGEEDDLLARSRVILAQFYQRSFSGFPAGVQHFVEDRMVTVAGHRCPVSQDDALAALARCRVKDPAATLQSLVSRRLISSEERHGVPWFEITHDVLVPVVKASKDKRLARQRVRRLLAASAGMVALIGILVGITAWALESQRNALFSQKEAIDGRRAALMAEASAVVSAEDARNAEKKALEAESKAKASLAQTQEALEKLKAADARQEAMLLKACHGDHEAALRAMDQKRHQEGLAYFERALGYAPTNREALAASATFAFGRSGPPEHAPMWRMRSVNTFESGVRCVAFSPDGRWFAAGDGTRDKGEVRVIEADTAREVCKVATATQVTSVLFSPDSRHLAVSSDVYQRQCEVQVIEAATGKKIHTTVFKEWGFSISYSPDGRYLAVGNGDGTASIIEADTGKMHHVISFGAPVTSVSFSPNGSYFAVGCKDRTMRVFETSKFKEVIENKFEYGVNSVCFSPDSRHLAVADGHDDSWVLDVVTGKEICSASLGRSFNDLIMFSPDGRFITCGSSGNFTADAGTGEVINQLSYFGIIKAFYFSPDGRYLALGCVDKTLRVIEVVTGHEVYSTAFGAEVNAVSFSPDGRYLVAGGQDMTARLFEPSVGREVGQTHADRAGHVLGFSADGTHLIASLDDVGNYETSLLGVYSVETGEKICSIKCDGFVFAASFSSDFRYLVFAEHGKKESCRVLETKSWTEIKRITADGSISAAISPDGRCLAVAMARINSGGGLRIFEMPSVKEIHARDAVAAGMPVFSSNSRYLAATFVDVAGSEPNLFKVFETDKWREVHSIGHGPIFPLIFSPDSRHIAAKMAENKLGVYDVAAGAAIFEAEFSRGLSSVAFSPDGRNLVTCGEDQTVRIFDAATGREIYRAGFGVVFDLGITALRVTPDGSKLLAAGWGPNVYTIDLTWLKADPQMSSAWTAALQLQSGFRFHSNGKMTALSAAELLNTQKEVESFCGFKPGQDEAWSHAILKWARMAPEVRTTSPWTQEPLRAAVGRWIMQTDRYNKMDDIRFAVPWHPLVPLVDAIREARPLDEDDLRTRKKKQVYPRFLARLTLKRLRDADEKLYGRETLAEYAAWSAKTMHRELKLKSEALEAIAFALERTPPDQQKELLELKAQIMK